MTSFVIRTENDEDLGFLGFARHDGEWPPEGPNDCILNGLPLDPALADDPRGGFVAEHKGREWTADVQYTDTEMMVRINFDTGWVFELRSSEDSTQWVATRGDVQLVGTGIFL